MADIYQLNDKPQIPQDFFVEKLDDSLLILHPDTSAWLELNATGLLLLQLADGNRTINDIVLSLAQRYQRSPTQVSADTLAFFNNLSRSGFLGPDRADQSSSSRAPAQANHLFLHLTQECNLACPHCYTHSDPHYTRKPGADKVEKLLDDCAQQGFTSITISGGEPLLYPELEKILHHARAHFHVSLITNGTLLTPSLIKVLKETCHSIQISLDGSTAAVHDNIRGPGSYDETIQGLKLLQDSACGDKVSLCATVSRKNIHDVPAIIDFADRIGIPILRFLPLMVQGRASNLKDDLLPEDRDLIKLYDSILPYLTGKRSGTTITGFMSGLLMQPIPGAHRDQWCPVGRSFIMKFNGDIAPCILMMDKNWKIGNLFRDKLSDIMNNKQMQHLSLMIRRRRDLIERCRTCSWKNLCQAGCPGIALQHTGTFKDVDRFCDYRRELYPRLFSQMLRQRREQLAEL
ncbi:PqqD family peptide modification chaperone [candidate division CSSED10-310 bacterium]|uniref:PqqD family peptide modification chaperone n=1 Tax=candidate division CSSED10-310 bacterium TaxID=2855610 RepID=A0ABV6YTQ1_UNCC1